MKFKIYITLFLSIGFFTYINSAQIPEMTPQSLAQLQSSVGDACGANPMVISGGKFRDPVYRLTRQVQYLECIASQIEHQNPQEAQQLREKAQEKQKLIEQLKSSVGQ